MTEPTGTLCTDESRLQQCRQSRWLFFSRQLLYFWWRLPSQHGLCAWTNRGFSCVGNLVDYFWGTRYKVLWWRLPCQQRLCARTNPGFNYVGRLVDYFWVVRYSVFGDDYRVNKDCVLRRNKVSAREAVSVMIFELVELSFRWRFPSQLGLCALTNPGVSSGGSLVHYFWVVSYPVFGDDYRVNRGCARRRNQVSAREAVLVMIFELVETHCWCRFLSQMGLCALTNLGIS